MEFIGEKLLQVVIALAIFAAVIGLIMLLVDRAPKTVKDKVTVAGFLAPAAILMLVGLVYPAIRTSMLAFTDAGGNANGFDNFVWMFTQPEALTTLRNTVIWTILVPLLSTSFGLAYAVFIDKARGEKVLKSLVFMPMAISFVGAGIIWKLVYDYRGPGIEQTGVINFFRDALGMDPKQFLLDAPENTFFLIIVMVWIQTGFAMVILSAAIKGVPVELTEAARLDGANAWQQFRNVTVPGIRGALVVVLTTITIATLKVFDIVRTMTAGNYDTSVVANEMYTQAFRAGEPGRGAALALILFLMVLPIVVYNARVLRKQREIH
ncbi:alpha-glucoside transport system permease protein [Paenarthrobacter nicotinovorans]|uniref:Sugar ABC transporter permease n=1 Tax=Paenarthrobacter nicotinovorans TaxID=29320 RepID=A0ABV0GPR1_PAENI|nr:MULTISPECIES: sugar ABC transporter permease [Micrococcaceae]MDR6437761.1 alpha-glucoside transport system permease protein [Paenarthrobacter nicotinovorans]BCW57151.1 alpha-glucoside ABC transporter permease [Arthrobacter sp. StoSoilB20]SCZ61460.1 carbohydrate ABC transporter membrane protein 1, CUT1 family [Arthrobacter sp. UNCCL28]